MASLMAPSDHLFLMVGALGTEAQDGRPVPSRRERWPELEALVFDVPTSSGDIVCDIEAGEDEQGNTLSGSLWTSSYDNSYPSDSDERTRGAKVWWDFLAVLTAVCEVYSAGTYIKMMMLDARRWEPLREGTTFRVSRSKMLLTAFSSRNHRRKQTIYNRLVMKRNDYDDDLTAIQARSFVKELRVLDHMRDHPFIVDLRAVGWFGEALDEDTYGYKPAILLEEAFDTLDYLIGKDASLAHDMMLSIFAQITSALQGLHSCGIAHGDLKPGNILLFETMVTRESVQIESYIAKLSDFESVRCRSEGAALPFPPGTPAYRAPEVERSRRAGGAAYSAVSFEAVKLADAWSLGMVFAAMLAGGRRLKRSSSPEELKKILSRTSESSTAESEHHEVINEVLKYTLCSDPSERDLDKVGSLLEPYLVSEGGKQWAHSGPLVLSPGDSLVISHESLKDFAGPFKDKVTAELKRTCGIIDHPRRPKALWELGIMCLSRFANPDASIDEGLGYVLQAAQEGEARAETFCHQLYAAFGRVCPSSDEAILRRLTNAAVAGYRPALAALWERDRSIAVKAQAAIAEAFFGSRQADASISPLHKAAAMGKPRDVATLLKKGDCDINKRSDEGDTPLILACRFGNAQTALLLLDCDAKASIRNKSGENPLHYAWCFDTKDGPILIRKLVAKGAGLHDISRRQAPPSELDIFPVLSGTPIERVAGRLRHDLVLVLIELGGLRGPSNGRLARRLLLYALRLHDTDLIEILLPSVIYEPSGYDAELLPIIKTKWLYQGEERSLLDAACAGWATGAGVGLHTMRVWLVLRHGARWRHAIYDCISLLKRLRPSGGEPWITKKTVDNSIKWAFRESRYDALLALLRIKFEFKSARNSLLCPIEPLTWNMGDLNATVLPPQEIYLIDRIFYDRSEGGTLAQQAILHGDRYMFRLLTRKFRANAALPCYMPPSWKSLQETTFRQGTNQMNLYSMLPYTSHRDLWFGDELRRLGVPLFCPWDTNPFDQVNFGVYGAKDYTYPIPIMHTFPTSSRIYLRWLLRYGNVSVEDKISAHHNVLQAVMRSRSLHLIAFFFKGPRSHEDGAAFLPQQYRSDGGSEVLRLFFDANSLSVINGHLKFSQKVRRKATEQALLHPNEETWSIDPESPIKILSCYSYLLSVYPDAQIPLTPSFFNVVTDKEFVGLLSKDEGQDDLEIIRVEHKLRFPRFKISHTRHWKVNPYLLLSPASLLPGQDVAAVMSIVPGMTFDYFSPGLLWRPSRIQWCSIAAGALWAFGLWLCRKLLISILNSDIWNAKVHWILYLLLIGLIFEFLRWIYQFIIRVVLTVIMLLTFAASLGAVMCVGWAAANLVKLRRLAWPLTFNFIAITLHLLLCSTLLMMLSVYISVTAFWLKQEGGIHLIPYFL
ncbi:hypothetical protein F5Y04DRAFT_166417 [Hypomontagnella monticulosa]|nr:hypothetical protein F5Y04DRAFT_166417 [Hypomontagnella monticulosa]